jgi:serine/threonine-protein kinase
MRKLRNEADSRPLAGTEGGLSPFFSPDGRWVGFVTATGRLKKVPVEGGAAITLTTDANLVYLSAAWLDDGTIVYIGASANFMRIPGDGGAARPMGVKWARGADNSGAVSPLPGSRGFLFVSCPGNCAVQSSVYLFDIAADSGRRLVADAFGAWYSPTGHLLYAERSGALFAAGFDPRRMTLTSSAIPVIENVMPGTFAMSASGSVAYAAVAGAGASAELMWVSRDGRATALDSGWRTDFQYPALSPDGLALAVSVRDGSTQIWIRRADGTRQRLTDSGSVNWRPSWTPDGKSIVFLSNRLGLGQGAYDAYEVPVDGSAAPTLLWDAPLYGLWEAQLSPDNQWLAIRSDEEGGIGHMRTRRLRGDSTVLPLVVDKYAAAHLSISPDGHWLAYTSERTGRREVYVTSFPVVGATHLVSRDGGNEPRWARNGRELFYREATRLMAVPITPGATFVAGTPRPLFSLAGYREARNRQQYDVAPDAQHFVMIREFASESAPNVIYVENWLPELAARMKAKR